MNIFKTFLLLLIISTIFIGCGPKFEGTFSTSPVKPEAAEEITVMYNPAGTPLEGKAKIDMIAYLYSVDVDEAVGVEMKKEGEGYIGSFSTLPGTRGVIVKFVDSENYELEDNNDKTGYLLEIYDGSGNTVEGSKAGLAAAYYLWGSSAGLERDGEKSITLFEETFAENPDLKDEYLDSYFKVLVRIKPEQADSIIGNELNAVEKKSELSEDDLSLLATWFAKINVTDKAEMYKTKVLEAYPNGEYAQEDAFALFDNAPTVDEKIQALNSFKTKFPESKKKLQSMHDDIVYTLAREGSYEKAYRFVKDNPKEVYPYYFQYTVTRMMNDDTDPKLTMQFAEEGVRQAQIFYDNPYLEKSSSRTVKEWDNIRAYYLGLNQYKYGQLIYESGSVPKGLSILESAIENTDRLYSEQDLKNYYGEALVKANENQKAMDMISKFIEEGNGSSGLQANLKSAFVSVNGNEEGYDAYVSKFTSAAEAEMMAELKTKMINDPAPAFTLKDLEGKEVSLSDYKGKTVIVDFWATWCGPCLRSFPGMQLAVEKYKDDETVAFLFVNTWERVDNKIENASNFISENNYPFHVLMDLDNSVITDYKVEGIPTKFIIGPDQNIKFKSVGFSGNIDQMAKEIELMVDLAKG